MKSKIITTYLQALFKTGDVFEIRILDAVLPSSNWQHTESGYFDYDHIETVPNLLANFKTYGGVYITLNPVKPDLLARANNRFKKAKSRETTSDKDVLCRRWMLIDVDPVRPAGISATETERSLSFDKAAEISAGLETMGWPKPMCVNSGNGTQLLYRINLPADDGGLIQHCLQELSPCSTEDVHVDLSVHNPARICRLPGTWNRKGDSTESRPHRIAEIFELPEDMNIVSEELLQKLAGNYCKNCNSSTTKESSTVAANSQHITTCGGKSGKVVANCDYLTAIDDFNQRGELAPILEKHGWTLKSEVDGKQEWCRPGRESGPRSAIFDDKGFKVFSENAQPFEPKGYNRFGVYKLLEHNGDDSAAIAALKAEGYGHDDSDVDFSGILGMSAPSSDSPSHNLTLCEDNSDKLSPEPDITDPGPIPEKMFHVPGFVGEIVDFCLQSAPYPNLPLAFCGALALQSHLCARKICESGDLRTNLYLLALAGSSGGKNFPRNINTHILTCIGEAKCLGDKFASGEGLQDELFRHPVKLYQNDEIDGLIQAVNKSRDGRLESIMSTLLTMFTSSNTLYPMRSKAGKDDGGFIDQPHLTIFGTATPKYYYEALSERMLTNGFFARMIIVDVGKRPEGQEPKPVKNIPKCVIDTARWWHELQPGSFQGNLANFHPVPNVVPYSQDAQEALRIFRNQADIEYSLAEDRNDEVAKTVWGRANENARKLAMLYACSTNHENPYINITAAQWAMAFIDHQVRRMLYMAGQFASSGEFDAQCKNLLRKLRKAPSGRLEHSMLLKRMKVKAKEFRDLIETLAQRGDVEIISTPTKGRPTIEYVVKEGVL